MAHLWSGVAGGTTALLIGFAAEEREKGAGSGGFAEADVLARVRFQR